MKFYFEIKYANGSIFRGHNLTDIKIIEDIIILSGLDYDKLSSEPYHIPVPILEITYFKIWLMD